MSEYLRRAQKADMDLLFQWANEPEVRQNSFSTAQIPYEEHKRWFAGMMEDSSRIQYIYMADDVPVGQIRVDISGSTAEIGYSICDGWRGKGHGKKMLALLREQVLADKPEVRTLIAKVKDGNQGSEQAFLKSGYRKKYVAFEQEL